MSDDGICDVHHDGEAVVACDEEAVAQITITDPDDGPLGQEPVVREACERHITTFTRTYDYGESTVTVDRYEGDD